VRQSSHQLVAAKNITGHKRVVYKQRRTGYRSGGKSGEEGRMGGEDRRRRREEDTYIRKENR